LPGEPPEGARGPGEARGGPGREPEARGGPPRPAERSSYTDAPRGRPDRVRATADRRSSSEPVRLPVGPSAGPSVRFLRPSVCRSARSGLEDARASVRRLRLPPSSAPSGSLPLPRAPPPPSGSLRPLSRLEPGRRSESSLARSLDPRFDRGPGVCRRTDARLRGGTLASIPGVAGRTAVCRGDSRADSPADSPALSTEGLADSAGESVATPAVASTNCLVCRSTDQGERAD
jgi:hypothetical protein